MRGRGELAYEPSAAKRTAPAALQQQRPGHALKQRVSLAARRDTAAEVNMPPRSVAAPVCGSALIRRGRGFRDAASVEKSLWEAWQEDEEMEWQPGRAPLGSARGSRPARLSPADAPPRWEHDQFQGPRTVGSAVFVRNLPPGLAAPSQLAGVFAAVGQVASVQVDSGPLPTATIGFVRQDSANEAERRFHGRRLQGVQMKVSVKELSSTGERADDEDFWRQELKAMSKRPRRVTLDSAGGHDDMHPPRKRVKGRGAVAFDGDNQRRGSIFDRLS